MPLTREPRNQNIYTDEVDQKGGYTAKVRDKEARAAAKEAAETAKADLDAYKETNDAAVAALDDRLDQAELDIDAAEDRLDELDDAIDVMILIQNTQPTQPKNKIWIKETGTPVEIPEMSDIADFVSFAEDQTSRTDAEKAQARANIGADWTLVWENANTSSAFAAQTVPLDLESAKEVMLVVRAGTYWSGYINCVLSEFGYDYGILIPSYDGRADRRNATLTRTGITFTSNYYKNTYAAGSDSTDNKRVIPFRIYAR